MINFIETTTKGTTEDYPHRHEWRIEGPTKSNVKPQRVRFASLKAQEKEKAFTDKSHFLHKSLLNLCWFANWINHLFKDR